MRKKIIIILAAVLLVAVAVIAACNIVSYYKRIGATGLENTLPYGFGKEATVILLAGQSNAAGCSHDPYLQQNTTPEQYEKYKNGFDNIYINYFCSSTNVSGGFVNCAACQGEWGGYFGPELGLAEKLNELYPDETFFIIKWAWGGTNLYEQWRSPSAGNAGPLYHGFMEYVKNSLAYLEAKNYNVKVEAMCWMQGESDSINDAYAEYQSNLTHFIADVRAELQEFAADDGIAFVDATIAASIFWKYYKEINAAKQAVAGACPMNALVDTIAHGLTVTEEPVNEPDIAHFDSMSEIKLGHLFAEECAKFLD